MTCKLSERLAAVCNAVRKNGIRGGRLFDVGSDHGMLAGYCLDEAVFDYCVCTDIHKAPAERTKQRLSGDNYSGKHEVHRTDGLTGISLMKKDTVVIAGMGGNMIMKIVSEVLERTDKEVLREVVWCVQPQKSAEKLREFFSANGFEFEDESVCRDRGFYYCIMTVRYTGAKYCLSLKEKYYGPVLLRMNGSSDEDGIILKYFRYLDSVYGFMARGNDEIKRLGEQ